LYFITDFANVQKEEYKPLEPPKLKKKMKKQSQLRAYNSQLQETILLKFGMWGAEGGGRRLHYENDIKFNKGARR